MVAPAIETLLPRDAITGLRVSARYDADGALAELNCELAVGSDRYVSQVFEAESMSNLSVQDLLERQLSGLQDFVAESKFAWGELRPY